MKRLLIGAFGTMPLQAAVVIGSIYEVETVMDGNLDSDSATVPSGAISSVQDMVFNNNHSGPIRAAATSLTQTDNHAGPGSFSFSAGDLELTERPGDWPSPDAVNGPFSGADGNVDVDLLTVPTSKAKIEASSNSTSTVTFELGIGEVVQANLTLNYTIEITNGNQNEANVTWTLTHPDMSENTISGYDTRNVASFNQTLNTGEMSAILDEPGIYSLALSADIPLQDFNNNEHSASATLNAVYFEVIPVPEAGTSFLLVLALGAGLGRRQR